MKPAPMLKSAIRLARRRVKQEPFESVITVNAAWLLAVVEELESYRSGARNADGAS